MPTNYFEAARSILVAEIVNRRENSQESLYEEPEFSEEALVKMSEKSLRALCECLGIDFDDFERRAAAEAAEEEDSQARRGPDFETVLVEAKNKVLDVTNIARWLREQLRSTVAEKQELVQKVESLERQLAEAKHQRDR